MPLEHQIITAPSEEVSKTPSLYDQKLAEMKQFKEDTKKDYIFDQAEQLFKSKNQDPERKAYSINKLCQYVLCWPDYNIQDFYIEELAKKYGNKAAFKKELKELREVSMRVSEESNAKQPNEKKDWETVEAYGFFVEDNKYFFQTKSGEGFKEATNFYIEPLFHIYSKSDNKRLIKITNEFGYSRIIDVPSSVLVSPDRFQQFLFEEGNFLIFGSKHQFMRILNYISNKFPLCHEFKTLGWQSEGFYAFANGIYDPQSAYQPVDDYGITRHKGENYFSPAFSIVYKDVRQDDDEYENDRYFVYRESPYTFAQWSRLFQKVYGENGTIGVAYTIAATFRSFIYERYKVFPHLFCFGEKGSGKSQLGWSISSVFMAGNQPFNLNSGTDVAFFRRLSRYRDCAVFFDEYTNNVDEKRFQALKSAYDGVGREKGKLTRDSRTEVDKVNSACCIAGQYLPTRDDNSLYTRSIVLTFSKQKYDEQGIHWFDELKAAEKNGMSSLVVELLEHRALMQKEFIYIYQETFDRLRRIANDKELYFEERILRNYVTIYAAAKVFELTPVDTGINLQQLEKQCFDMAIEQSEKISSSDALASFWNMVVYLLDTYQIQEEVDFNIREVARVTVVNKKGEHEEMYLNKDCTPEKVLFIQFGRIHPLYMKEHRSQHGEKGLELSSLRDYVKYAKGYLGYKNGHRFAKANTSAYVFRYSAVGVNLERDVSPENGQKNNSDHSQTKTGSNIPTPQQGDIF